MPGQLNLHLVFAGDCSFSVLLTRSGSCNAQRSSRRIAHKLFTLCWRLFLTPSPLHRGTEVFAETSGSGRGVDRWTFSGSPAPLSYMDTHKHAGQVRRASVTH